VITSAVSSSGNTMIMGTVDQSFNGSSDITVEFFANPDCDPSGFGEGKTFLGSTTIPHGSVSTATFTTTLPQTAPADQFITATSFYSSLAATSGFSRCRKINIVNITGRVTNA